MSEGARSGAVFTDATYRAPTSASELLARYREGERYFVGAELDECTLAGFSLDGVNLTHASLRGADLTRISLRHCRLVEASFEGASLGGAVLSSSTLNRSTLREADLNQVTAWDASLLAVDLRGASLVEAILGDCNLSAVDLRETLLTGLRLGGCNLAALRLDGARDLSTVEHFARCALDVPTIERLAAEHEAFLADCQVPRQVIGAALSAAVGAAYCDCFISYSRQDRAFATHLQETLQHAGVCCWRDEQSLPVGSSLRTEISRAIRARDRVLLICSTASLQSTWVNSELTTSFDEEARRGEHIILPVLLDDYLLKDYIGAFAAELRDRHAADFREWACDPECFSSEVNRLLAALRQDRVGTQ
ncbi:MAG: toll/interleukin-1 receptor domain-containing protein [Pseudomonadota bacterium]